MIHLPCIVLVILTIIFGLAAGICIGGRDFLAFILTLSLALPLTLIVLAFCCTFSYWLLGVKVG